MFKLDLEKAEKPEIKYPTSTGSSKKAREHQKNIYFCFIDYARAFTCVDHNKLWKILRDVNTRPPYLPPRNLYAGQEAKVDAFLELLYIFDDPADVGSLISGSSAFSKSNLNIWNFTLHLLLKTFLENFEHYFAGM